MAINLIFYKKDTALPKTILQKKIKVLIKHLFRKNIIRKFDFNFIFVDNKTIRKLKKKFFGQDITTDVICFKYDKFSVDVVISLTQVKKNSKIYKTSYKEELLFVIAHGLLHFKGMKDDTKKQREKMFEVGSRLIKKVLD